MKIKLTLEYGMARKLTYTVYNDWSMEKLYKVIKQIEELIGFNK